MYHEHTVDLKVILARYCKKKRMTNKEKRYHCYRDAVSLKWGTLGNAMRKRVGWYWENKCRVAFPDSSGNYTGLKIQRGNESEE